MGLLTLPVKLPLLPLQGVIKLAEVIGEQAERELHDPARVRRELEEAERRHAAGEISDEELRRIESEATGSLISGAQPDQRPGAQPTRRSGAQPARRSGGQPEPITGADDGS